MNGETVSRGQVRAVVAAVAVLGVAALAAVLVAVKDVEPLSPVAVEKSSTPPPATSPSSAPSRSESQRAPEAPSAAKEPTPEGATAFFRFFWESFNYSYESLDSSAIERLSATSCASCLEYVSAIETAKRGNETFTGGRITVLAAVTAPDQDLKKVVVDAVLSQEPAFTLSAGGTTVTSAPGTQRLVLRAALRWQGDRWTLLGMDSQG